MGIYGNIFKPVEAPSEEAIQLAEAFEAEVIKEATEMGVYTEAKFHLFKVGDSSEYKKLEKDLKDAEQILNANNENIDVNKVGHALLHGTDKVVELVNAGSSIGSFNPYLIPVALVSKLVSFGLKTGKEKEALRFTDEAITKLQSILDAAETDAEKERIQKCIDKLLASKHTLEVGKKGVRKEEKAAKKEEKAIAKEEKKEAREEKRALKKAAKEVKKNKDDEDDEEITAQVEAADFIDFCNENNIPLTEEQINAVMGIVNEKCCDCDDKDDDDEVDDSDKEEVNKKAAEELSEKEESANIYSAFRLLMSEATDEQIEKFLEATADQVRALKDNPDAVAKFNKGLAKKMAKDDAAQSKAEESQKKVQDVINNDPDNFGAGFSAGYNAVKSGAKAIKSAIKTDKAIEDTIDKDEKAAYKENEKRDKAEVKAAEKAEKKAAKAEKAAAKNAKAAVAAESVEDLFNFVMENDIEITEDLYNTFVEAGLIEEYREPEFESYEEYVNYCLENGIQKTKEELEAIKESFLNESGKEPKDAWERLQRAKWGLDNKDEKKDKEPSESEMLAQAKKEGKIYVS